MASCFLVMSHWCDGVVEMEPISWMNNALVSVPRDVDVLAALELSASRTRPLVIAELISRRPLFSSWLSYLGSRGMAHAAWDQNQMVLIIIIIMGFPDFGPGFHNYSMIQMQYINFKKILLLIFVPKCRQNFIRMCGFLMAYKNDFLSPIPWRQKQMAITVSKENI